MDLLYSKGVKNRHMEITPSFKQLSLPPKLYKKIPLLRIGCSLPYTPTPQLQIKVLQKLFFNFLLEFLSTDKCDTLIFLWLDWISL